MFDQDVLRTDHAASYPGCIILKHRQVTGINILLPFLQKDLQLKKIWFWLNYVDTPVIKEQGQDYLILGSIRKKVWNPVFTVGVITFVCSMIFRGFLDEKIAVFPLGISTLVLFSGIWILSSAGSIIFDRKASNCYVIYTHLGYLRKIYSFPLSSFDQVILRATGLKVTVALLKDNGEELPVAHSNNELLLTSTSNVIAEFLQIKVIG